MVSARSAYWGVVVATLATLCLASPALGVVDVTDEPPRLGGGDATVADAALVERPAIESGRFGTARTYLRGPTAEVAVSSVSGHPRLVVRIEVPALAVDDAATRVIGPATRGRVRLSISDRSVGPDAIPVEEVPVHTTVRVQSYDVDRVVV